MMAVTIPRLFILPYKVGAGLGSASAEATLMQVTVEPLISAASSLFTAKCFLYQTTYIRSSKISSGERQAVSADLAGQVEEEFIHFLTARESAFQGFT